MDFQCPYKVLEDLINDPPKVDAWIWNLIIEIDTHIWNDDKYIFHSLERSRTYTGYLANFCKAWNNLKKTHNENCKNGEKCNCPSENKQLTDALEDAVKKLDNCQMEKTLESIIDFVHKNKNDIPPNVFAEQMKHAADLFRFWKGMERLAYAPHLTDIQAREIGRSIFKNKRRIFNSLFPTKKHGMGK